MSRCEPIKSAGVQEVEGLLADAALHQAKAFVTAIRGQGITGDPAHIAGMLATDAEREAAHMRRELPRIEAEAARLRGIERIQREAAKATAEAGALHAAVPEGSTAELHTTEDDHQGA